MILEVVGIPIDLLQEVVMEAAWEVLVEALAVEEDLSVEALAVEEDLSVESFNSLKQKFNNFH